MAPVRTIAVIIAMEAEAAPLVAHLGLKLRGASPFKGPLPALVFSGEVGGATVHVCTNGKALGFGVDSVGTVPAALTAYNVCITLEPDVLINAGTAGGFKAKGGAIGDVYLATAFKNHDRRIPIPGFDAYGVGTSSAAACPALRAAMGFKDGIVSTGNSLDATPMDLDNLKVRSSFSSFSFSIAKALCSAVCTRLRAGVVLSSRLRSPSKNHRVPVHTDCPPTNKA